MRAAGSPEQRQTLLPASATTATDALGGAPATSYDALVVVRPAPALVRAEPDVSSGRPSVGGGDDPHGIERDCGRGRCARVAFGAARYGLTPGITAMIGCCVAFSFVQLFVKQMVDDGVSVWLILLMRNATQLTLGTASLVRARHAPWAAPQHRAQLFARAVLVTGSVGLYYLSLALLPMTYASVLGFTDPIFTAALAVVWLREPLTRYHIAAIALCVAGSFAIVQPAFLFGGDSDGGGGGGASHVTVAGVVVCLGGSALSSVSSMIIRQIRTAETPDTFTFWLSAVAVIATLPPVLVSGQYAAATTRGYEDWAMSIGVGVCAYVGQLWQVYSYARTHATLAVTVAYSQLIVMILCAVLLYGEKPNAWAIGGMAAIVLATLLLLVVSARNEQRERDRERERQSSATGAGHSKLARSASADATAYSRGDGDAQAGLSAVSVNA